MKVHAFNAYNACLDVKATESKEFMLKLSSIKNNQKEIILKEYFFMCQMVYHINSTLAYFWNYGPDSYKLIHYLYNQDEVFAKMIKKIKRAFLNVF